ncbi:MAG: hypothetical protein WKG06_26120 [Segetibacter sp.]
MLVLFVPMSVYQGHQKDWIYYLMKPEDLYRSTKLSPQLCELRNLISVGYLIVKGASFRKESRGLHFNTDYPEKSTLKENIVL